MNALFAFGGIFEAGRVWFITQLNDNFILFLANFGPLLECYVPQRVPIEIMNIPDLFCTQNRVHLIVIFIGWLELVVSYEKVWHLES